LNAETICRSLLAVKVKISSTVSAFVPSVTCTIPWVFGSFIFATFSVNFSTMLAMSSSLAMTEGSWKSVWEKKISKMGQTKHELDWDAENIIEMSENVIN
jgi:hypothetical protein